MQGLGGLASGLNRGATMSGNKGGTDSGTHGVKLLRTAGLTAVSATFTVPSAGRYQVALYGAGGAAGASGGGAGGLAVYETRLQKDEQLPYTIAPWDDAGTPSTITLRDGVMTANSSTTGVGAGATGPVGGVYLTGGSGVGATPGAAPSYGGFVGGAVSGAAPGAGAAPSQLPGAGMIIITKIAD